MMRLRCSGVRVSAIGAGCYAEIDAGTLFSLQPMPSDADRDRNGAGGRPVSRRPLAVDLFAGAGGLSLGLEQAGFDVVAAVEYDPVHAATHEFNFPLTETLCADIANLEAEALREAARKGIA